MSTEETVCSVCSSQKMTAGTCNWRKEPHCRTCCNDQCDPEWRRLPPEPALDKEAGLWMSNGKLNHYFVKYHAWSACRQEHRSFTKPGQQSKQCQACLKALGPTKAL